MSNLNIKAQTRVRSIDVTTSNENCDDHTGFPKPLLLPKAVIQ